MKTLNRIKWLILIYAGSVLALGIVSFLFKFLMSMAGMRTH